MAITNLIPRLKTPGVYVEEIPKLPPSIAQVETAIPAFIGYTEKSVDSRGEPLLNEPTRITSLLEYERYFGGADTEQNLVVDIVDNGGRTEVNGSIGDAGRSRYTMFYALQLFFINGGGPCWIVSTGDYINTGGTIVLPDLQSGLAATERESEITLYVFPDAQGLDSAADFYELYTGAINLCVKLQDRFTVTDVWQDPSLSPDQWFENIDTLRNTISSEVIRIKYAASYFPNLQTTLDLYYGGEGRGDENVLVNFEGEEITLADLNTRNNGLYYQARSALRAIPCEMPPSPAVVGIYARVDASRGVWKAPANVSVDAVIKPSILLTDEEQG